MLSQRLKELKGAARVRSLPIIPYDAHTGINSAIYDGPPLSLQRGKRAACFQPSQHTRINFPPDKLLQPSADNQMIQMIRPEAESLEISQNEFELIGAGARRFPVPEKGGPPAFGWWGKVECCM